MSPSINPALEILLRYRQHIKTPFRGRLLAIAVVIAGALTLLAISRISAAITGSWMPIGGLSVALIVVPVARRLWLADAFTLLRRDVRKPILYLRSFDHDETPGNLKAILGTGVGLYGVDVFLRWYRSWIAPEARLCPILKSVGPVITFGRPGDILNVKTACRIKVDHSVWQELMHEIMAVSALVVIDAAGSLGLLWELEQALTEENRKRLIIILPTGHLKSMRTRRREGQTRNMLEDPSGYMHIRNKIEELLHYSLPRTQGVVGFIRFDDEGRVIPEPIVRKLSFSRLILGRVRTTFVNTLRSLGFSTKPYRPRFFAFTKTGAFLLTIVFVFFVYGAVAMGGVTAELSQFLVSDAKHRITTLEVLQKASRLPSAREQQLQIADDLQKTLLPQLRSDREQLQKIVPLLPEQKQIAGVFLRYSAARIQGLEELRLVLMSGNADQISTVADRLTASENVYPRVIGCGERAKLKPSFERPAEFQRCVAKTYEDYPIAGENYVHLQRFAKEDAERRLEIFRVLQGLEDEMRTRNRPSEKRAWANVLDRSVVQLRSDRDGLEKVVPMPPDQGRTAGVLIQYASARIDALQALSVALKNNQSTDPAVREIKAAESLLAEINNCEKKGKTSAGPMNGEYVWQCFEKLQTKSKVNP